ncbi:MAG: hypothetical protein ACXAB7_12650 [Candidatus Kariarchaeaceae archaeon]|jgi:hypothetical protein
MRNLIQENGMFFTILTGVWLILLSFCALIGILIVPVDSSNKGNWLVVMIAGGKVLLSLLLILFWLIGWYKTMNLIMQYELQFAGSKNSNQYSKEN